MNALISDHKHAATERWNKKKKKKRADYNHGEDGMITGNARYGKKGKTRYQGHPSKHRNED